MKLRTTGKSIRLRLSQTDVQKFAEDGIVEEVIPVRDADGEAFSYRLIQSDSKAATSVTYANNCLTVSVPSVVGEKWAASEDVGIEASQPVDGLEELSILIEKDFACLTRRTGDDDKDAFPHPAASEKNC